MGFLAPVVQFIGAIFVGPAAGASAAYTLAVNVARIGLLALSAKVFTPKPDITETAVSKRVTFRDPIAPQVFTYGEDLISGPMLYSNVAGSENRDLYVLVQLCGHEIDSVTGYRIDSTDIPLTDVDGAEDGAVTNGNKFDGVASVALRKGTSTQTVIPALTSAFPGNFNAAHTGRGWAYMLWTFNLVEGQEEVFKTQPTNLRAIVRGKKVYDPRKDSTNGGSGTHRLATPSTWEWSNNPALCLADFIRDDKFGMREDDDRIDWPKVIAAANICDQTVSVPAPTNSQKRYTCNATFSSAEARSEVRDELLSAMLGRMVFSQGKWKIWAGASISADVTLSEANLAGGITVQASSPSNERYNRVRGKFIDADRNYTAATYVEQRSSTYVNEDGGEVRELVADFTSTQNEYEAQRKAIVTLKQSRQQRVVVFEGNFSCFKIQPGTTVLLNVSELGFSGEKFFVTEWRFSENGVALTMVEEIDSAWANPLVGDYSTRSKTGVLTFGETGVPAPTLLTATAALEGNIVSWTNPLANTFAAVQVWASDTNDRNAAVLVATVTGNTYLEPITEIANRTRYYWVRAIDSRGRVSAFTPDLTTTTVFISPLANRSNLNADPEFDLSALPINGSNPFWLGEATVGTGSVQLNVGAGDNGSNAVDFTKGTSVVLTLRSEKWSINKKTKALFLVSIKYTTVGTADALDHTNFRFGVRCTDQDPDASPGSFTTYNSVLETIPRTASGTWEIFETVIEIDKQFPGQATEWMQFQIENSGSIGSADKLRIDSFVANLVGSEFGKVTDSASTIKPGLVPKASSAESTLFLKGDGTWADPGSGGGGGNVGAVGTPADGQLAVWTDATNIEGDPDLFYDTVLSQLALTGDPAIRLDERTTGPSFIPAHGLLWVKDNAPTSLMFTDDAGNEIVIGDAASGVTTVTAGLGLTQNQTSGDVIINVQVGTGLSVAADAIGLNYSEISEKGSAVAATDRFAMADNAGIEFVQTASSVPLSIFNNDAGFLTEAVTAVPTPADGQIAVWAGADSIEGDTGLTYDTALNQLILENDPAIRIDERVTGPTSIPARGLLWMRADTPNTLMLTDDAGNEVEVAKFGAGVDTVTAGLGLTQNVTFGDVTINVQVGTGLSVAADSIGLNYSALSEKGSAVVGTDRFAMADSGGTEFVHTASSIPISVFNNDAGFITSAVQPSGTPVDGQIGVWTSATQMEGDTGLTYDTALNQLILANNPAIRIDERATGPTSIPAQGLVWVRDDAPSVLMFTDDAGNEIEVAKNGAGVATVTAGLGLTQNQTFGDVTINVQVGTGLTVAADSIGLNYSALAEKTGNLVGSDRIAACSSTGTEFVETISNIPLSIFNNDAGFTSGGLDASGTPANNQVAVWVDSNTLEGDSGFQYDTALNQLIVINNGAIRIDERGTGPSSIVAHGLLWVKNTAPTTLMFTDDVGNEIEVGSAASGVTSVTAGQGLTQNQTTGAVTLNVGVGTGLSVAADSIGLNYSALSEKTGALVGTDRIAVASGASEVCETISGIPLSIFNNDAGWTSNTGDITGVTAGTGLSGGGSSGSVTLALNFAELTVGGTLVGGDYLIAENGGAETRQLISSIPLSIFNNDAGFTAGGGITKHKTGNTTRTATTTFADDPHLLNYVLSAGTYYGITGALRISTGNATPDIKLRWQMNRTPQDGGWALDGRRYASTGSIGQAESIASSGTTPLVLLLSPDTHVLTVTGMILTGTGGTTNIDLEWAQNTLDVSNGVTILRGSYISFVEL